jgi:mannose-6-phosphate isomerase
MNKLYPLVFQPVFKERVWGGRRLSQLFPGLPDGRIGEAWVLSDHPNGRTPVINGALAGKVLTELLAEYGATLVGTRGVSGKTGAFPLLFKLLDAEDDLSVQVHPDDHYSGLPAGELGKTEMWVVLHAEPGAKVVYGLQPGMTSVAFAAAIAEDRIMAALRVLEVESGDVLFVPPGTVHALGTGLLVAEVQQSSDTTYRVYDYDRLGLDGQPRELHIEHALAVSHYGEPPAVVKAAPPQPDVWQELCRSPFFLVEQGVCRGEWAQATSPLSFEALMILDGVGFVAWDDGVEPVHVGTTLLVPASMGGYRLQGNFRCLRVRIP